MSKKTVKCKTCENEVAISARVCPNCGQRNPGITLMGRIIGISIFIVFIISNMLF